MINVLESDWQNAWAWKRIESLEAAIRTKAGEIDAAADRECKSLKRIGELEAGFIEAYEKAVRECAEIVYNNRNNPMPCVEAHEQILALLDKGEGK